MAGASRPMTPERGLKITDLSDVNEELDCPIHVLQVRARDNHVAYLIEELL